MGENVKTKTIVGITALSIMGAGFMVYNYVLSPRTKKKLMLLEGDMCEDFKDMMGE